MPSRNNRGDSVLMLSCPCWLPREVAWPAMQEETGFGWREQEPVEARPSASCTKERQPCLAAARCGSG